MVACFGFLTDFIPSLDLLVAVLDHLHGSLLCPRHCSDSVELVLGVKLASDLCEAVDFDVVDALVLGQRLS